LIHRNAAVAGQVIVSGAARTGSRTPASRGARAGEEELMSAAEQAFLLTGELFVLSFLAIGAFWFADKLRRGMTGKP
jgi:hypothetical protein